MQQGEKPRDDREGRHYRASKLPTLKEEGRQVGEDLELLLKLYDQTSTTWRMLVDVRFKLIALVPALSFISLAFVLNTGSKYSLPAFPRFCFGLLGLVATVGLFIYDLRNSQLHDDLISRGRKIEEELGVDTGVFRGRKNAGRFVKHGNATYLVYGAALLAWALAITISVGAS